MLPTTEACRKFYSEEEQKTLPGTVLEVVNNILDGNLTHVKEGVTTDKFSGLEYSDALRKLKSKDSYLGFTEEQRTKMALLVRSSFLCVTILRHIPTLPFTLPMDLYKQGYYAIENRGAMKKDSYETVKSSNLGLMLSYMWLPDNDEAKAAEIVSYPRIADRNTIKYPSDWVLDNFSYLVHPFSCSISGTMLIHHKVLKQLQLDGKLVFNTHKKFYDYLKSFVPLMLFNSGGHTFHEFMYPLRLPQLQEAFAFIKDYDKLNNETLFMSENNDAFNKAINKAISYNKIILANKTLQHSVRAASSHRLRHVTTPIERYGHPVGKVIDKPTINFSLK